MKEAEAATIHAQYRFVSGYHIFTSKDVRGLYVASKDAKRAFDSVGPILQELVSRKLGSPCEIEPTMTFEQFIAYVDARRLMPAAPVLGNREFVVRRAAA